MSYDYLVQRAFWAMISLICSSLINTIPTSANGTDTVYLYRDENIPLLKYYSITNVLEGVTVVYQLGEFQVTSGTLKRHVYLNDSLASLSVHRGPSSQGIQSSLLGILQTDSFTIAPTDDTISFYRQLSFSNVDTSLSFTSEWRFLDRSEFVVQLIRSSDDSVLMVLDSVGLDSTQSVSDLVVSYGTDVSNWCRKVFIPSAVRGVNAYIQLIPKRWGSTAYGMSASSMLQPFSLSALNGCTGSFPDSVRFSYFTNKLFQCIYQYWTIVHNENCILPIIPLKVQLSKVEYDSLRSGFMVIDTIVGNDTLYCAKPCTNQKRSAGLKRHEELISLSIESLALTTSGLTLELTSSTACTVFISLVELATGRSREIAVARLNKGTTACLIPTFTQSGAYVVSVYSPDTEMIRHAKLVVAR